MSTAKNGFQIRNLHPKKTCISKIKVPFFNANLLEKYQLFKRKNIKDYEKRFFNIFATVQNIVNKFF